MGSLLLVCAVLKTLHSVKCILNEEECRSVGKASYWWRDELAVVVIVKPPGVVQESLGELEEYKGDWWYDITAEGIKRKLCLVVQCNVGAGTAMKLYRLLWFRSLMLLPSISSRRCIVTESETPSHLSVAIRIAPLSPKTLDCSQRRFDLIVVA